MIFLRLLPVKTCSGPDEILNIVTRNNVPYQREIEAMGLLEKNQWSNILLRVSYEGMRKLSAGKDFKRQVGQDETEIRQQ